MPGEVLLRETVGLSLRVFAVGQTVLSCCWTFCRIILLMLVMEICKKLRVKPFKTSVSHKESALM